MQLPMWLLKYAVAYAVAYVAAYVISYLVAYDTACIKLRMIFLEFLRKPETTF